MDKNSIEKILVAKEVLHLTKDTKICWKDLKGFQFQDDDIINIAYNPGHMTENNMWDGHYYAFVTRPTMETDEEHRLRLEQLEWVKEDM